MPGALTIPDGNGLLMIMDKFTREERIWFSI